MASSKPKTTMNKLNRERKVREKRLDKEARKVARQNMPAEHHLRPTISSRTRRTTRTPLSRSK